MSRAATLDRLTDAVEVQTELLARRERRENERIRREHEERERRRIGSRSEPKQLTFSVAMRAVPGLAEQFRRKIPPEFWTLASMTVAVVSCPCGATPEAAVDKPVECRGQPEDGPCGRFYLFDGGNVRVCGGPKEALVD